LNPTDHSYPSYGLRGITICPQWADDFLSFKQWAESTGYTDGLSLERENNDRDYSPYNCHWVSNATQQRNKRNNHIETFAGETKTLVEWAEDARCCVSYRILEKRLNQCHWSFEAALTTPLKPRHTLKE
jgi:hypothetical protein